MEDNSTIVDFDDLDSDAQALIKEAIEARSFSYSPYSKFAVGACVRTTDGSIFRGCNVENALYGLAFCAERTAIVKAVSEGKKDVLEIAVIGDQDSQFTTPCGPCRQFMFEFNQKIRIYVTRSTLGKVLVTDVGALLPYTFHL